MSACRLPAWVAFKAVNVTCTADTPVAGTPALPPTCTARHTVAVIGPSVWVFNTRPVVGTNNPAVPVAPAAADAAGAMAMVAASDTVTNPTTTASAVSPLQPLSPFENLAAMPNGTAAIDSSPNKQIFPARFRGLIGSDLRPKSSAPRGVSEPWKARRQFYSGACRGR